MTSWQTWTTVEAFSRSVLSSKSNYSREDGNLPHKHHRPPITALCTRWVRSAHRHLTHNASAWLPLATRVMSCWSEATGKPEERWLKVNWIEWILLIPVRYAQQDSSRAGKWACLTGTCQAPVIEPLFKYQPVSALQPQRTGDWAIVEANAIKRWNPLICSSATNTSAGAGGWWFWLQPFPTPTTPSQQTPLLSRCVCVCVGVGAAWRSCFVVAWPCSPESDLVSWGASSQLWARFKAGKEARSQGEPCTLAVLVQ